MGFAAENLLESNSFGGNIMLDTNINPKRYNAVDGEQIIACESVQELRDIFIEYVCGINDLDIAMITESANNSEHLEALTESVKGMFDRIKAFLVKLWNKIKAFFHNLKRAIDAIFQSGTDFAKKYEKDIKEIKSAQLKDFTYELFTYTGLEKIETKKYDDFVADITSKLSSNINPDNAPKISFKDEANDKDFRKNAKKDTDPKIEALKEDLKKYKDDLEEEKKDYAKEVYAKYRDGAESKDEMKSVDVTDLSPYLNALKDSQKLNSALNKAMSKNNNNVKNMIAAIDKLNNKFKNVQDSTYASDVSEILTTTSSCISLLQNKANTDFQAFKTALSERDSTYKSLIIAAFRYAGKSKKSDNK